MVSKKILVINCGSSSLKYQLFMMPEAIKLVKGNVERIGDKGAFINQETKEGVEYELKAADSGKPIDDHKAAFQYVVDALLHPSKGVLKDIKEIDIVAHRVVHGGEKYSDSVIINDEVVNDIKTLSDLAPLHNPANLQGIVSAQGILPDVPQTATFDTAFHQSIPDYAYNYAIPHELYDKYKIRRYGFHGTSHRYVASKALQYCKRSDENTNIISCHLGNGSSITAINCGKSVDTSMGFTPLEGLVMGTRSGDLDPAIIHYLVTKGYSVEEVNTMLNKKSGLFGIYGKSDMRDLIAAADSGDKRAKLAIDMFTYRVKKYIGAYCAVMVKVDMLVFTGGIGENSFIIRELICRHLENIGIHISADKNKLVGNHIGIISEDYSPVTILVIPTDEEKRMAIDAYELATK